MPAIVALVLAASMMHPGAGAAGPNRFEAVEPHMGTLVRLVVYAPDAGAARAALAAGFDRIRELEQILSDYRPDSEVSRLATAPAGRPIHVSADLFAVLRVAQDVAAMTDGAFDVTQAPVTRLWREARASGRLPDSAALEAAAERSGFRKLSLDDEQRTVTTAVAGMGIDAGGIGKGYAASAAVEAITGLGVHSALAAVSGDLAFSAAPPGQSGWRIAVSTGDRSSAPDDHALVLEHAAVSTSGASAQHLEVDDSRYSHIIDPARGMGLRDDITVTVVAPTGAEADALATAVSVLGVERGLRVLDRRPGLSGLVVVRTGADVRVYRSARYPGSAP